MFLNGFCANSGVYPGSNLIFSFQNKSNIFYSTYLEILMCPQIPQYQVGLDYDKKKTTIFKVVQCFTVIQRHNKIN